VETRVLVVDFGSIKSVREAATKITTYPEPWIDVFIHNAGLMDMRPEHRKSIDGIDEHLAINFVGGFLFTNLILSKILAAGKKTGDARIVIVASSASAVSPVRFHDLNVDKSAVDVPEEELPNLTILTDLGIPATATYVPWVAYGQSKTAAILFAVRLADLLKSKGVTVNSLHPGGRIWEPHLFLILNADSPHSHSHGIATYDYGRGTRFSSNNDVLEDFESGCFDHLSCGV
jgi:NAD(P)-dependent dehydrogenase (short-subunit alcohol dehydrogenase family)